MWRRLLLAIVILLAACGEAPAMPQATQTRAAEQTQVAQVVQAPAATVAPTPPPSAAGCWSPAEALAHAGQNGCVQGQVTGTLYATSSTGQPTFIDITTAFTAVIWQENRGKFTPP